MKVYPNQPDVINEEVVAHIVLDSSGSMFNIKSDTIGGFNEYKNSLAKSSPNSKLSLTVFNSSNIRTLISNTLVGEVKDLTDSSYNPTGSTPLYDAIGSAITILEQQQGKNKVLVIITDGLENSSKEYDRRTIKKLLDEKQEKDNWLVLYLGANQDAFAEGSSFGGKIETILNYVGTGRGIRNSFAASANATLRYARNSNRWEAAFTEEERKLAVEK